MHSRLSRGKKDNFIPFGNSIPVVNDKLLSPLLTSIRNMILLVEQPINHEHAHPPYFVTSKQPKNKGYPLNPIKSVAATNTTHQQHTSQGAPTYPYFSKPLKYVYFSSTSPLLAMSIPEQYYKSCLLYTSPSPRD